MLEITNLNGEVFVFTLKSRVSNGKIVHEFSIKPNGLDTYQEYQFEVTCIPGDISIVSNMQNNNNPLVSKKGISFMMIEYAYTKFGHNLYSSTNSEEHKLLTSEFRSNDAEKIWLKLSAEGRANYIQTMQRYKYM